jgi:hypothetical protein
MSQNPSTGKAIARKMAEAPPKKKKKKSSKTKETTQNFIQHFSIVSI